MTGHELCEIHPKKLLGHVAVFLHISPNKCSADGLSHQQRTPKELSSFLGLPTSQTSRFGKEVWNKDRGKIKRVVTWLSTVVTHIAKMVTIVESPKTTNQSSEIPAWMTLMGRVTHQLKIKPTKHVDHSCCDSSLDVACVNTEQLVRTILSR